MSTEVKRRRGTALQHETFTGAPGEITVVTDDNSLRVHDGVNPGGTQVVSSSNISRYTDLIFDSITQSQGQTFQMFMDELGDTYQDGKIKVDVAITAPTVVGKSVSLYGGQKDKGDRPTIIPDTGQSGLLIDKTFVAGVDENIVSVTMKGFKIIEQSQSKTASTVGILYNRVNKLGRIEEIEVRGFEKGINLKGVIGGVVSDVFVTNNTYGLYTESNNDAGLAAFDCTNVIFLHGVFNANDYGVYLGDLTQGMNFYGTDIERNNIVGVEIDATPPASSVFNFFGAWFEGNPIALRFTEKVKTVQCDGCYFFDNTNLWDNAGSGVITATFERCKIDSSHIDLDVFRGRFVDNDVTNCTFTATTPEAYQCEEWRGTAVAVDDGNTLLSTRSIGSGRYAVEASGAPGTTVLADGSTWFDIATGTNYTKVGGVWQRTDSVIINDRTVDFGSIPSGGSATFGPVTVTGASVGDHVEVVPNGDMQGVIFQAHVSSMNAVSGTLYNFTGGAVDLPSITYRLKVQKS